VTTDVRELAPPTIRIQIPTQGLPLKSKPMTPPKMVLNPGNPKFLTTNPEDRVGEFGSTCEREGKERS
jgi:hypothetical protein